MSVESSRPWRLARTLDVLIFLLFILDVNCFFQLLRFLLAPDITASSAGREPSDSEPDRNWGSAPRLSVGLMGRGEKVPWLHGPSWAVSLRSSSSDPRRGVCSLAPSWCWCWLCCLLGPARLRPGMSLSLVCGGGDMGDRGGLS